MTCYHAVEKGHVEMLRWARENGCPWSASTRIKAGKKLGYTDDFGNEAQGWDMGGFMDNISTIMGGVEDDPDNATQQLRQVAQQQVQQLLQGLGQHPSLQTLLQGLSLD